MTYLCILECSTKINTVQFAETLISTTVKKKRGRERKYVIERKREKGIFFFKERHWVEPQCLKSSERNRVCTCNYKTLRKYKTFVIVVQSMLLCASCDHLGVRFFRWSSIAASITSFPFQCTSRAIFINKALTLSFLLIFNIHLA